MNYFTSKHHQCTYLQSTLRSNFSGTKGPIHTFNNYKANFYISTGSGGCSINGDPKTDADYFCRSFYGPDYNATSYKRGSYDDSGRMGYQMHRRRDCYSGGEDIYGTNNNLVQTMSNAYGNRCKIWSTSRNYQGLYNIVCSNDPGISKLMSFSGSLFIIILKGQCSNNEILSSDFNRNKNKFHENGQSIVQQTFQDGKQIIERSKTRMSSELNM